MFPAFLELLASRVIAVWTVFPVSPVPKDNLDSPAKTVCPDCPVPRVARVKLAYLDCPATRATAACPVFPDPKVTLDMDNPVYPVALALRVTKDLLVWMAFRAIRVTLDRPRPPTSCNPDRLVCPVNPATLVPRVKRAFPALMANAALPACPVFPDSRVTSDRPVPSVLKVFPEFVVIRANLASLVNLAQWV